MSSDDDLLDEYDFSTGVRGKYAKHARDDSRMVSIEPDLFEQFPSDQAVNDALRELLRRRSEKLRNSKQ
jgi:hypothetical protein